VTDGTHSSPKTVQSGRPYVTVRDVSDGRIDFENCSFIDEADYRLLCKNGCNPLLGDVLFSKDGTVGKVALVDAAAEFVVLSSLAIVRPDQTKIASPYLAYAMQSPDFLNAAVGQKTGVAIRRIILKNLKQIEVPFPSLPEQRRIVAILDEAFDEIATAKTNTEKNLQNARDLFESHLQSVFTEQDDGWTQKPLGEMATFRNGINFTKTSKGEPIKILGVKDFQKNYWAPLEAFDSIIPDGVVPEADTLKKNDIVFVRSNGNPELIGRCLLVGDVTEKTTHSGFTIKARLHSDEVSPTYLCHFLKSGKTRRAMIDGGNGANIRSLNQGTLSRILVPYPSPNEQMRIVARLEEIQSETEHLESVYRQKLVALEELKKSLLHQAFSGQL
jgi:type I restriction enzyme S subunit